MTTSPRAAMRPFTLITGAFLIAAFTLSACAERREDRIAFDGVFFRSDAKRLDRENRERFEVTVRPVSQSLEGARAAGAYEATRYCIENFGTSDIIWVYGPDGEAGTLRIANDRLTLEGACDFD